MFRQQLLRNFYRATTALTTSCRPRLMATAVRQPAPGDRRHGALMISIIMPCQQSDRLTVRYRIGIPATGRAARYRPFVNT